MGPLPKHDEKENNNDIRAHNISKNGNNNDDKSNFGNFSFYPSGASRIASFIKKSEVEVMEGKPHGLNLVAAKEVAASIVLFRHKNQNTQLQQHISLSSSPSASPRPGSSSMLSSNFDHGIKNQSHLF